MAITRMMKDFARVESAPGIVLFSFAILAIIITNSGYLNFYQDFFSYNIPLNLQWFGIYKDLTVKDWINDAFMAVFFLFVGLELKREMVIGELSTKSRLMLPAFAAIGGVLVPALIYLHFNIDNKINLKGWAIPTATDIAFAIGVLNLFGSRINSSLKVFLVALAVLDDLAAILIIATFYSKNINIYYIDLSIVMLLVLLALNRARVTNLYIYIFCGIILWIFILKSGVHATIAGVLLALFVPIIIKNKKRDKSPLHIMEHNLHHIVGYIILPIFAFANSGISFKYLDMNTISGSLVLGIFIGLFIGKQVGVFTVVYLMDKLKICKIFKGCTWLEVYGVCVLTGIGFTMSLFIGGLAFDPSYNLNNEIVLGVLAASLMSGIFGFMLIHIALKLKNKKV